MTETILLVQTATTAETLNQMVAQSAEAFHALKVINEHLHQAIHTLQEQIDLMSKDLALVRNMSL